MQTTFIVTTAVKQSRGSRQVVLGAYSNREQAEQRAIESLTEEGGILCDAISLYKKEGYESPIVERTEGNAKEWGKWCEGADWYTQTSFLMAAKVEEVELK